LLAAPAHAQQAPAPPQTNPGDDYGRIRELYGQGSAAFKAGNSSLARQKFLEAWDIRQTYDVASSLGQVELDLKRYRDAAEHLDFSVRHFAPVESRQTLEQVERALKEVKEHVGSLRVSVDRDRAEVRVDDREVGASPLVAPLFVDPGPHSLQAHFGGDVVTKTVTAIAGVEQPIELALGAAKTATGPVPDAPAQDADPKKNIVPAIVGGAAFAVGLGAGIGFSLAASSEDDRAKGLRAKVGRSGCLDGSATPGDCANIKDAADAKDRDRNLATAGFVLAGAALIATPLYWFLWPDSTKSRTGAGSSLRVGAAASPGVGSFWVSGQF
jgi:hypothetical protein